MFQVFEPVTNPNPPAVAADAVVAKRTKMKHWRGAPDRLTVMLAFGAEVAGRLGLDKGKLASIAWGLDKDLGKLRIEAAAGRGWKCRRARGGGVRLLISQFPGPLKKEHDKAEIAVAHEILTQAATGIKSLLVTLPAAWFEK